MGIFRSLAGSVRVRLTSADLAGALSALGERGISVYQADPTGPLDLTMVLARRDYPRAAALFERRGEKLEILGREGAFWPLAGLRKRPVLVCGLAALLALAIFLPTRVLFVQVEGNGNVPARLIVEQAAQCGIGFGASRREVRSEKMKNALLEAIPELQWAGVNTSGCVAVISVRERTQAEPVEKTGGVCSIVASRDGVISSCTVLRGNQLCRVGQAVQAGEVLVSGYTDVGLCIQATQAEAEIFARTQREMEAVSPENCLSKGAVARTEKKYSLILGKNRIHFFKDSGIFSAGCDKMYAQYTLTLPGGFELPVALAVETWVYRETAPSRQTQEEAGRTLTEFSKDYLARQMVAGSVLEDRETIDCESGVYRLTGVYACQEMIGRVRSEEMIESGKNH